jgi:hypothetical protein
VPSPPDAFSPSYAPQGRRQPPLVQTEDGRPAEGVDLDRGTFLPLDTYTALEMESIADESLGPKRRALLDDLRPEQLREIMQIFRGADGRSKPTPTGFGWRGLGSRI